MTCWMKSARCVMKWPGCVRKSGQCAAVIAARGPVIVVTVRLRVKGVPDVARAMVVRKAVAVRLPANGVAPRDGAVPLREIVRRRGMNGLASARPVPRKTSPLNGSRRRISEPRAEMTARSTRSPANEFWPGCSRGINHQCNSVPVKDLEMIAWASTSSTASASQP